MVNSSIITDDNDQANCRVYITPGVQAQTTLDEITF